ncbi:MAG: hypothetical protein K0S93_995 [Nitrososphaeraceae archaeon]|jgi:hypothetical protein|nr:hypothetical protein [Nitrososphaeraceae archaeon]
MTNFTLYFHKHIFAVILIGFVSITTIFVSITTIESPLFIQLTNLLTNNSIVEETFAQPPSTNISIIINNNSEEQNKSKMIKAFGHFANNQLKDGIVTWIQGGFWNLNINNITNSNVNNNNTQITNYNGIANFTANFTMIKPDGSLSHNHNIQNFISDKVILTDKDIVVMGIADIYSDDSKYQYKTVPLTIHLMSKKVLGLTIDVGKTKEHFSSSNEMFGTLISGIGLDTSADNSINKIMMHHDIAATNDTDEKETMATMQH